MDKITAKHDWKKDFTDLRYDLDFQKVTEMGFSLGSNIHALHLHTKVDFKNEYLFATILLPCKKDARK